MFRAQIKHRQGACKESQTANQVKANTKPRQAQSQATAKPRQCKGHSKVIPRSGQARPRQSLSKGKPRHATGQAKSNPSKGKYRQGKAKAKVQFKHSQTQIQSIIQSTHHATVLGIKTWGANADDYSATILPLSFIHACIHTYMHSQRLQSSELVPEREL